ncbi:diaminobutyrate--2-oxoglutarate transaminase [Actinopolymorpha singaporensis]|uniref:Diaminobutyrate--2-oxoglutarate transaminase n=1 Tax=Actinopolymorpha singaporensis TaxID=117157 RepID=A0A1H1L4E4_9ACTN|nr:diaminobutyrate--2-oxoglutarate transaminase [Actinopolymorpha singaporensis]SDR68885.1 diaminobutyrate-2-oxoglutarate transaminase [Actinopolymorpha singaporensis]
MDIFQTLESDVRSYCRGWPATFDRAVGSRLYDESGRAYLDFFAGAGVLNYGHNNPVLKRALIEYLERDGITHSLDMNTVAKRDFLQALRDLVLRPRNLDYKVMFPGPAGANAVEAALKLACKVTGRHSVVSFTNGFHGMTLGALAVTGNSVKRAGAGVPLAHTAPMPYDGYLANSPDFELLTKLLDDRGSGLDLPAAFIVETVQGEGGLNTARIEWLQELAELCRRRDILLIVDDVQMGCGRTGPFFSFEIAGLRPDIVCLSKAIGGYGLPLALTLFRPELDIWTPGEHNGTFRGINPAFVAAAEALRTYWRDDNLEKSTVAKGEQAERVLADVAAAHPGIPMQVRGRGLARGLALPSGDLAERVCRNAFERGLLLETSGPEGEVVKLLPPLTVTDDELDEGLSLLEESVKEASR